MEYRTINLKRSTYQKLSMYKAMGKTFDDVINNILDEVDPMEMYEQALAEHNRRLEAMKAGEYVTLDELKKKLKVS